MLELTASCTSMLSHDVLAVLEVDEGPELRVCPEDDVSSPSAVASVRTSLRNILLTPHVGGTCATVTGTAIYLYIVYEIAVCHNLLFYKAQR